MWIKRYLAFAIRYTSLYLILIITSTILMNSASLIIPLLTRGLIDSLTYVRNVRQLDVTIMTMLWIIATFGIANVIVQYISVKYFLNIEAHHRRAMFHTILDKPHRFFYAHRPGEISYRLNADMQVLLSSSKTLYDILPCQLVMLGVACAVMVRWNIVLSVLVIAIVTLQSSLVVICKQPIYRTTRTLRNASESMNAFLIDAFRRIALIKDCVANCVERSKYERYIGPYLNASLRSTLVGQLFSVALNIVGNIWTIAIIWYGGKEVIAGNMTVGQLVAFIMYANLLATPITFIVNFVVSLQTAKVSYHRLTDFLESAGEFVTPVPCPPDINRIYQYLDTNQWEMHINNITFSYTNGPSLFSGLSYCLPPQGITLLCGKSGSGKTTLCKLLTGHYRPDHGTIMINNINMINIPVDYLRTNIVYCDQNEFILDGSVRDNVCYGSTTYISDRTIERAIDSTSSHFIYSLSRGIDTRFGDDGFTLSNGQAQRIALMRAILKCPKVLLLDEPTSAVDSETEEVIYTTLVKLKYDYSIVLISHHDNAMKIADRVLRL